MLLDLLCSCDLNGMLYWLWIETLEHVALTDSD